jgi:hypothetical protein
MNYLDDAAIMTMIFLTSRGHDLSPMQSIRCQLVSPVLRPNSLSRKKICINFCLRHLRIAICRQTYSDGDLPQLLISVEGFYNGVTFIQLSNFPLFNLLRGIQIKTLVEISPTVASRDNPSTPTLVAR